MSKVEFVENYLFEKYKDKPIYSCKRFKEQIKEYENVDKYKIYRMILNYQIKKYGITLKDRNCNIPLELLRSRVAGRKKHYNNMLNKNYKIERWLEK